MALTRRTPLALRTACCRLLAGLAAAALFQASPPAQAHPHIFIETALTLQVDTDGQLTGVEVSWAYDQMYSMLVLDDMALDPEYDGVLTGAEEARLSGFDLNWIEGFEGDLYLARDGAPVALEAPQNRGAQFEDGRVVSRHFRALTTPVPAAGLTVKAYDPSFYTAYDLGGGVTVTGPCRAAITKPVRTDSYVALAEKMAELPRDADDVPQVGETFAETITLTCGGRT
ncbi:DUF1007 family protein [Pseudooceanicola aestuarii]|uniref:DUF1007 family protein n=1 Tax=Pseudooceanicola aestuarii TaxID=2697319 RepID=UPI0013CFD7FD|nr:DUF1007 family protein [Pseudooceanicola aestuarii]